MNNKNNDEENNIEYYTNEKDNIPSYIGISIGIFFMSCLFIAVIYRYFYYINSTNKDKLGYIILLLISSGGLGGLIIYNNYYLIIKKYILYII